MRAPQSTGRRANEKRLSARRQIHRGDAAGMIAKERSPILGGRHSHVLDYAGLLNINPEFEEFAMDPGAPQRGLAMLSRGQTCV